MNKISRELRLIAKLIAKELVANDSINFVMDENGNIN